ncbi:uncharacterized protein [Dysidea avara]|uniref:uncharacterized protein isoform X2 n=1 Tax=Dysidea avara TaxID=196820 RepID=UPI00332C3256
MMERSVLYTLSFHYCLLFLTTEVELITGVTQCVNRIGLLDEASLIHPIFGTRASATSSSSPHVPTEVSPSGFGWCSDFTTCASAGDEYIEIDFAAEIVVEAISIFGAAGGYVTQYNVEYARSSGEFNCVTEQESNQTAFSTSSDCSLVKDTRNFSHPVLAQFIRVTPTQWVGTVACLRMELYGCFVNECPVTTRFDASMVNMLTIFVTSAKNDSAKVLELFDPYCAAEVSFQRAIIQFNEFVYLTRMRASSSNGIGFRLYYNSNDMLYVNVGGIIGYAIQALTIRTISLWLPINSTRFTFELLGSSVPPCFAVELSGCLSHEVVNHIEDMDASPVLPTLQTCQIHPTTAVESTTVSTAPVSMNNTSSEVFSTNVPATCNVTNTINVTSTVYLITSIITVQVTATSDPMVQLASSDNDNCGPAIIVVPIVVIFIAIGVVTIVVVAAIWWRRSEPKRSMTSMLNSTTCVVENDLYQSQDVEESTKNSSLSQSHQNPHTERNVSNIYYTPDEVDSGKTVDVIRDENLRSPVKANRATSSHLYEYPAPSIEDDVRYETVSDTLKKKSSEPPSSDSTSITAVNNNSYGVHVVQHSTQDD